MCGKIFVGAVMWRILAFGLAVAGAVTASVSTATFAGGGVGGHSFVGSRASSAVYGSGLPRAASGLHDFRRSVTGRFGPGYWVGGYPFAGIENYPFLDSGSDESACGFFWVDFTFAQRVIRQRVYTCP
jgi:hypothetical protein